MKSIHNILKTVIILYSVFVSCYTTRYDGYTISDAYLEELVDDFMGTCDSHGFDCSSGKERPEIVFGKTPINTLGVCQVTYIMGVIYTMPLIIINHELATNLYREELKLVVYHELIHCYFFIDHHPGDKPHIMRSYALSPREIEEAGGVEKLLENFFHEYKSNKDIYNSL